MAPPSLPPPDPHYHVAQVNVARVLAPLDSPALRGFVEGLEPINALADRSPGFVWRLQTEAGDATATGCGPATARSTSCPWPIRR